MKKKPVENRFEVIHNEEVRNKPENTTSIIRILRDKLVCYIYLREQGIQVA